MFLKDLIDDLLSKLDQVNMDFDTYFDFSTKSVTRTKRTTFLKSAENKRELNEFLAKRLVETVQVGAGKIFTATCYENVLVVPNGSIDVDSLQPCNQEEADTRMFLHAVHAYYNRSTRVTIKSNASDIVILGTTLFPQLDFKELYVTFGRDKSYQVSQAICTFNFFSCNTRQILIY